MSKPRENIRSELAALADGSLPAELRAELLAQVEASPELAAELALQREALTFVRSLEQVSAPQRVHRALQAQLADGADVKRTRPPVWRAWRTATTGALGAAAVALGALVALVVVLAQSGGAGPGAPSMQQAANLTLARATLPSPPRSSQNRRVLAESVEGVWFPYWQHPYHWQAMGSTAHRTAGRTIDVVYYRRTGASRGPGSWVGYVIVSGPALAGIGGASRERHGIRFELFEVDGAQAIAWRRQGHTCILAGRGMQASTLMKLASAA